MKIHEKQVSHKFIAAISESIDEVGAINKSELKEYIDLNFEAEDVAYKNRQEMKDYIYKKVLEKKFLFIEDLSTGELKRYSNQKDISEDLGIKHSLVSNYIKNNKVYKGKYLFMSTNKILGV